MRHRTEDLKPIMELLPREEWSAASCHETVIAERVASLASLPVKPLGTLGSLTAPGTWHHELFAEPGAADRPVTLPTPLPILPPFPQAETWCQVF